MLRIAAWTTYLMAIGPALAQTAPPDDVEKGKVLADAAAYARLYEESLPNFMCIQTTRRFGDYTGLEKWLPMDTIVERLTYFEHKEEYKVIEVNGQSSSQGHNQLGGTISSGEFGSVMKGIFASETQTEFTWQGWFTLRGRRMHVYSYRVAKDKSDFHVVVPNDRTDLVAAYHGLVFIDERKHFVFRITLHADEIPRTYPVQDVSLALDFEFTQIAGADYLLPLSFELRSREGASMIWKNDVDYALYSKFDADSTITFGATLPPGRRAEEK